MGNNTSSVLAPRSRSRRTTGQAARRVVPQVERVCLLPALPPPWRGAAHDTATP
jgi:hypothetical protein